MSQNPFSSAPIKPEEHQTDPVCQAAYDFAKLGYSLRHQKKYGYAIISESGIDLICYFNNDKTYRGVQCSSWILGEIFEWADNREFIEFSSAHYPDYGNNQETTHGVAIYIRKPDIEEFKEVLYQIVAEAYRRIDLLIDYGVSGILPD
ncbi:MAG: hypothetical protein AB7T22_13290 [Calditrichaceae bacterium]